MDLNTKVKRSAICAGVSVVWSARLGSFSSFCSAACTAASIGTLVNSDSTSKDTMISLSRIVSGLNWSPCTLTFLLKETRCWVSKRINHMQRYLRTTNRS